MNNFIKENEDNITEAVHGLDIFTKNWCMNVEETKKKDDLVFRCDHCHFCADVKNCKIKSFAHEHEDDPDNNYDMSNFGAMA